MKSASCFKCSLSVLFIGHSMVFFGRVGRIVSNEVNVQLVKSKCFPVLFMDWRPVKISPLTMSLTVHLGKFSILGHKRLLMFSLEAIKHF